MSEQKYQIGMVGMGVMGRNLLLNISEHGFTGAGYDKDLQKVSLLRQESNGLPVTGAEDAASFIASLEAPRAVILLVPAGPVVDNVIRDLLPYLSPGDLVIDAGNSHFTDTNVRQASIEARGLNFFGMGVSGGEAGARHGPSLMPGGSKSAYERVRPVLEAASAKVNGDACVAYLGPGSAGHYVKMVHNGIEYGLMQLIAETYDLLRRGLGLSDDELSDLFKEWNQSELNSYLIEITSDIFCTVDEMTGKRLVDVVLDAARQLGTGMWASQDAFDLHVPTPTIDIAVSMRNLSGLEDERAAIISKFARQIIPLSEERKTVIAHTRRALYAAAILAYAQGFSQLQAASAAYQYNLELSTVARIWRGGCIIRSALLEPIRSAYGRVPDLPNLLLDEDLGEAVATRFADLQKVVQIASGSGIPAPAFMATLAYYDSLRSPHLPANLIQAQRDYFGAHTYERVDRRGVFHTQWSKDQT
jgi:6-phosphogluconate dehydrogenase